MLINFVIDCWDDKTTLTTLPQIMSDKKNTYVTYVSANPTDHNFYYPQLDKNFSFWLVNNPCVQNSYYRLVVT